MSALDVMLEAFWPALARAYARHKYPHENTPARLDPDEVRQVRYAFGVALGISALVVAGYVVLFL